MEAGKIKALLVPCWAEPRVVEIENSLEGLRGAIGAKGVEYAFSEPVETGDGRYIEAAVVCDDEGKLHGMMEPNRAIWPEGAAHAPSEALDVVYGDFLVVATDMSTGEDVDLPPQAVKSWSARFADPSSGFNVAFALVNGAREPSAPARGEAREELVPPGVIAVDGEKIGIDELLSLIESGTLPGADPDPRGVRAASDVLGEASSRPSAPAAAGRGTGGLHV